MWLDAQKAYNFAAPTKIKLIINKRAVLLFEVKKYWHVGKIKPIRTTEMETMSEEMGNLQKKLISYAKQTTSLLDDWMSLTSGYSNNLSQFKVKNDEWTPAQSFLEIHPSHPNTNQGRIDYHSEPDPTMQVRQTN